MCIIGTTTRIDATELLEKRLRSRFSQRQIVLEALSRERVAAVVTESVRVEEREVERQSPARCAPLASVYDGVAEPDE